MSHFLSFLESPPNKIHLFTVGQMAERFYNRSWFSFLYFLKNCMIQSNEDQQQAIANKLKWKWKWNIASGRWWVTIWKLNDHLSISSVMVSDNSDVYFYQSLINKTQNLQVNNITLTHTTICLVFPTVKNVTFVRHCRYTNLSIFVTSRYCGLTTEIKILKTKVM